MAEFSDTLAFKLHTYIQASDTALAKISRKKLFKRQKKRSKVFFTSANKISGMTLFL